MVGRAEVSADPVADRFRGGAGLGDAIWGPSADQGAQAQQQGAEAALLLIAFQEFQSTEAGLQHLGHEGQPFALDQLGGLGGHEL